MSNAMSNAEWITARLGDVANINMGQSPPSSAVNEDGPGLPFIPRQRGVRTSKSTTGEVLHTAQEASAGG